VEDVPAPAGGLIPATVVLEIRGGELEPVPRVDLGADRGSDLRLTGEVADGGPYPVAAAEELYRAPAAEEAGAAGDENRLGLRFRDAASLSAEARRPG
jgi:hypothetical protein